MYHDGGVELVLVVMSWLRWHQVKDRSNVYDLVVVVSWLKWQCVRRVIKKNIFLFKIIISI